LEWGGTRKKPNPKLYKAMKKNMEYLKMKYHDVISTVISSPQDKEIITFTEFSNNDESQKALTLYKRNNKKRIEFQSEDLPIIPKIKHYLKRMINSFFQLL
jgi:hypothetical protein